MPHFAIAGSLSTAVCRQSYITHARSFIIRIHVGACRGTEHRCCTLVQDSGTQTAAGGEQQVYISMLKLLFDWGRRFCTTALNAHAKTSRVSEEHSPFEVSPLLRCVPANVPCSDVVLRLRFTDVPMWSTDGPCQAQEAIRYMTFSAPALCSLM